MPKFRGEIKLSIYSLENCGKKVYNNIRMAFLKKLGLLRVNDIRLLALRISPVTIEQVKKGEGTLLASFTVI